jgi:hypothetical protein
MDVAYWPHVENGLYTENDALKVFDQYFEGIPSSITHKWIHQNRNNEIYYNF